MFEFLFLVAFTLVLIFTGVSLIGVLIAVAAGFAVMAVVGMLGLVFKLLPWIVLIALGIWHPSSSSLLFTFSKTSDGA